MKLVIHRGSKEIGGTCVELQSRETRIIWGRMSIIDTKPFMLLPGLHSIFVHKLQATGSPA